VCLASIGLVYTDGHGQTLTYQGLRVGKAAPFDDFLTSMKILLGFVGAVVCVIVVALLFVSTDVVENHYSSLANARADHLFERGWLPDILPASAHDIRTRNNLDLSLSDGEFSFEPAEAAGFVSRVQPYRAAPNQLASIDPRAAKMRRKGFELYSFIDQDSSWVFSCKAEAGYCEYTMWIR